MDSATRPLVVLVITRGERGGAQVHVHDLVTGLSENVDYHVVLGDDGFLGPALRAAGVTVTLLPALQRSIHPRTDRRALLGLSRLLRELKPDLVHTHSTKAGLLGRLAAWRCGVPVVHTAHAWSFSDGLSWKRKSWAIPVEALAGRITDRFITVSEADREVGTRWRVARWSQVRVVHNGVPDVVPRASPGVGGPPVIALVARMAPPKDHALMLSALAAVQAPFLLRLIGDGPDRSALEAQARELGIADHIEWLGVRSDVPELLADAHIFALVSRQEGFSLAILEAMRAGLPVVASDVGGVTEAVRDGHNGIVVPRGDLAGLTGALDTLLADPPLRVRLGQQGRADFDAQFSLPRMLDATLHVYRELIGGPPAAAGPQTPCPPRFDEVPQ